MNKYKILENQPYEEGATYELYVGKNVKKDEKVSIKQLKKKYYSLEECKNNKEVQVMQKLDDKNVQKLLDLFHDSKNNQLLMVLEYIPDNLKKVMKRRDSPFTELETKGIMQQVFRGLAHMHKIGIMHRNLRPEFLLCDKEASSVKISDFSMAKSVLDPLGEYAVTPVWYMAPEVLLGASNYTTPIDMWAAGCIMAELLTAKPLLPGTSDRDQMKLICELLGTFTKREWPDGAMLRHSLGYSLPADTNGKGLGAAGVMASGDAKDLIGNLLVWTPEKRMSADMTVRHDFFKSDGEFVNTDATQEILSTTEERLRSWRSKWEADLNRGSLTEFERILAEFSHKKPLGDKKESRHHFPGFEHNNPLLGDSTPRKWDNPPQNVGNKAKVIDDPFRPHRPKGIAEQPRSYPLDLKSPDKNREENVFEDEQATRGEKRSRQSGENVEPLFAADGSISPRRRNESPRRNVPKDELKFGIVDDSGQNEHEMKDKQIKAEKLKQQNYLKYRAKFGDDFMSNLLGAKPGQGDSSGQQQQPPKQQTTRGQGKDQGGLSNRETARTRDNAFGHSSQNNVGESLNLDLQTGKDRPPRKSSFDKYASIDHTARSEKLREQNPVKYQDKYGGDMRQLLGGKPADYSVQATNVRQTRQNKYGDVADGGEKSDERGQYIPSWTQKEQIRT